MKTLRLRTGVGLAGLDAVAREKSGRVVFVEGAAPEEEVRVEILAEKKRHARARTLEVLTPSPHRVAPLCPHHEVCGGCGLQHVQAEVQTEAKVEAVRSALRRIGGTEPRAWGPTWRGEAYGVRSRVRWRAGPEGVGLLRRRSHALVPLDCCPILEAPLEKVLVELRAAWAREGVGEDEIDGLTDGSQVWLHRRSGGPALSVPGAVFVGRGAPVEISDRRDVRVAAVGAFGQTHRAGNDAMLGQLEDWLDPVPRALELYAGAGNWTRVLAGVADEIVAVERDADAAGHIRRVAPRAEVWTADAGEGLANYLRQGPPSRWGLLANPPRTGLGSELVKAALRTEGLAWLVYVSCDPATFARDAARLAQLGLRADEVRVFDLYPQTAHVELMARFLPST